MFRNLRICAAVFGVTSIQREIRSTLGTTETLKLQLVQSAPVALRRTGCTCCSRRSRLRQLILLAPVAPVAARWSRRTGCAGCAPQLRLHPVGQGVPLPLHLQDGGCTLRGPAGPAGPVMHPFSLCGLAGPATPVVADRICDCLSI
jgi:hypothetical protein